MYKNKKIFSKFFTILFIILLNFYISEKVFANPVITSFLLNNSASNVTFNPNYDESISIEVKSNVPVKFTRLYICSMDQICNGTSGNYTRYFTQTNISDTITKSWNGKKSGDIEIVPEGEYRIMVSMTEGTNPPVAEFGQFTIKVDFSNNIIDNNENNSTTTDSTSTITNNTASSNSTSISSHSSSIELSNYDQKESFEVSAGRERMASVGSPIEFDAKYTVESNNFCAPIFKWSFGDGFDAVGNMIKHTYKYGGVYQIILNASCGNMVSIARTVATILLPKISISKQDNNSIKILNNNNVEINLGLWKIGDGTKDFIFPQDTIISQKSSIILSYDNLDIESSSSKVSLYDPSNNIVTYINLDNTIDDLPNLTQNNQASVLLDGNYISISSAEKLLKAYKETLALNNIGNNQIPLIVATKQEKYLNIATNTQNIVQTAAVYESINTSTTTTWSKMISVPVNSIKSFLHMFYDF